MSFQLYPSIRSNSKEPFLKLTKRIEKAEKTTRLFYMFLFFISIYYLLNSSYYASFSNILPLWPVQWVPKLGISAFVYVDLLIFFLSSLVCIFREIFLAKILCFLSLFFFVSFLNSFGNIVNSFDGILWASFFFVFLSSSGGHSRAAGYKRLQVFLAFQCMLMTFYTLAGGWKVVAVLAQTIQGQASLLSLGGFSRLLAEDQLTFDRNPLLGDLVIGYPFLGFLLIAIVIYFELFATIAIFRTSLHRIWGFALIAFHIGAELIIGVAFRWQIVVLLLFIVFSPFYESGIPFRARAKDLPLIGRFL